MQDTEEKRYFLVSDTAASDVHQKVIRVKERLMLEPDLSVNQACKEEGLSRSTFYKYRHDIYPYEAKSDEIKYWFRMVCNFTPAFLRQLADLLATFNLDICQLNQIYLSQGHSQISLCMDFESNDEALAFSQQLAGFRGISDLSYRAL